MQERDSVFPIHQDRRIMSRDIRGASLSRIRFTCLVTERSERGAAWKSHNGFEEFNGVIRRRALDDRAMLLRHRLQVRDRAARYNNNTATGRDSIFQRVKRESYARIIKSRMTRIDGKNKKEVMKFFLLLWRRPGTIN